MPKKPAAKAERIDLYKAHKSEYVSSKEPALVEVGPARYLAIEGQGEPGGERFQACVGALYAIAYTIKMAKKFAGRDYKVCGLEGLWWGFEGPRESWQWKMLIRVPEFITARELAAAVIEAKKKGKGAELEQVKLEDITEGKCVQVLHVGPYANEAETIARMLAFAASQGLAAHGLHHEMYLSDPRRVPPERLKTILRLPVA